MRTFHDILSVAIDKGFIIVNPEFRNHLRRLHFNCFRIKLNIDQFIGHSVGEKAVSLSRNHELSFCVASIKTIERLWDLVWSGIELRDLNFLWF